MKLLYVWKAKQPQKFEMPQICMIVWMGTVPREQKFKKYLHAAGQLPLGWSSALWECCYITTQHSPRSSCMGYRSHKKNRWRSSSWHQTGAIEQWSKPTSDNPVVVSWRDPYVMAYELILIKLGRMSSRSPNQPGLAPLSLWTFSTSPGCARSASCRTDKGNTSSKKLSSNLNWLVVSTHLKNISQNGNLPQLGVKIKNIWIHHLQ